MADKKWIQKAIKKPVVKAKKLGVRGVIKKRNAAIKRAAKDL